MDVNLTRLLVLTAFCSLLPAQSSGPVKSGIDIDGMDKSCKPCDDFYRYANGTFLDKNPIPARYSNWGTFGILGEANRERLKTILEAAAASKAPARSNERRIGDFYSSCMDTAAIDARGAKPIDAELKMVAGVSSRAGLVKVLNNLQRAQAASLFGLYSSPDAKNTSEIVLYLGTGGLSLPDRDYYFRDDEKSKEIRAQFVKHVARMLVLLGDDAAAAAAAANNVLAFETERAAVRLTRADRRNPDKTYNKMDLAALEKASPTFDWKGLLANNRIPAGTAIIVSEPKAVEQIEQQFATAELNTWKTWLRWAVVRNAATELSKPFYDEDFAFQQTVLNGVKEQRPRWQVCATATDGLLGEALGEVFVKKHFPPEAKRRMLELVENLRAALREELANAAWLEEATKQNALKKLNAFYPKIGYPDRFRDYAGVSISARDYFGNARGAAIADRQYDLAKIGKPVDRNDWSMTPPTVNAYYSPLRNEIAFPAGILQPPFFDLNADDAANYGAIGTVIGHEMGHGFDDQGSKFAADGSLTNWWTDSDRKKFEARAQCITDEFNTLEVGGGLPNHNGKLVTGEALGDLGGVTLAFKAYQRSLQGKPAPVIDGFTGEQRFFLSFTRVWARHFRPEAARLRIQTDPHPLDRWRAIGTLQNVPEFHKAFQCKLGDAMVRPPEKQCKLW
ncbi:MAG: M13 family metallopeptidase [Bryobacterales bacterium]|nr:M13 family metallopeptidase [Bryobacterales bacterium]